MSEYAKHIQTIEDMWKKRIEMREEGYGRMSEYIITSEQLKTATEAYLEHELSRPITEVFISGDKLPEIVRCRDCKLFDNHYLKCFRPVLYFDHDYNPHWTDETNFTAVTDATPDGFCAWGEREDGDAR